MIALQAGAGRLTGRVEQRTNAAILAVGLVLNAIGARLWGWRGIRLLDAPPTHTSS